jgi:hypothetical protein
MTAVSGCARTTCDNQNSGHLRTPRSQGVRRDARTVACVVHQIDAGPPADLPRSRWRRSPDGQVSIDRKVAAHTATAVEDQLLNKLISTVVGRFLWRRKPTRDRCYRCRRGATRSRARGGVALGSRFRWPPTGRARPPIYHIAGARARAVRGTPLANHVVMAREEPCILDRRAGSRRLPHSALAWETICSKGSAPQGRRLAL